MQDDTKGSAVQPDDDVKTASHDHMNGPGMTNGVPDQIDQGDARGRPPSEREGSESAAGKTGTKGASGS